MDGQLQGLNRPDIVQGAGGEDELSSVGPDYALLHLAHQAVEQVVRLVLGGELPEFL